MGFKAMDPNFGSLIGFACAPGCCATDGNGQRNGLFTKYLLKYIATPNKDIRMILANVTKEVMEESRLCQIPFIVASLSHENICLNVKTADLGISSNVYERKRALVIGIDNYTRNPLKYCINDANDLKATLEHMTFEVTAGFDCNQDEFRKTVETFANGIQRTDLTLFYFAGHGKQLDNNNYLLPLEYNYRGKRECEYIANHSIDVKFVMDEIEKKNGCITVFIFDCCRNYVSTRNIDMQLGLSPMNAPPETLIVFSCAPGRATLDETRNEKNGIFMGNLLKRIATLNTHIEDIFMNVAHDVKLQTGGFQQPYRTSSLTEKLYFVSN
ncbi:unnamed protein product [Rotaria sp. Silwood2]|nr:unnamed protein product [Rotaria sp. Silwood2]